MVQVIKLLFIKIIFGYIHYGPLILVLLELGKKKL